MPLKAHPISRFFARAAFALWLPVMIVPGGYLLGGHTAGLPAPGAGDRAVEEAIAASRESAERGAWLVLHVLYGQCGCSQRVLDALASRGPAADVRERVVLVDGSDAAAARIAAAGFAVARVSADELVDRYHLESAPLFAVADPAGHLRYLGGYTERKRGPSLLDRSIVEALVRGEEVAPIPILGCAVSRRLKQITNPLGVR